MTIYQMTYIINNLFMTYVLYRFLMIFFDSRKTGRIVELTFYCMYFIIISATVFFPTPPLFYVICSFSLVLVLSYLYNGSFIRHLSATLLIYATMFIVEETVMFIAGYQKLDAMIPVRFHSILGISIISLASFGAVLLIESFKHLRDSEHIPAFYWLSILFIPSLTIVIIAMDVSVMGDKNDALAVFNMISALAINLVVFYMYDRISQLGRIKTEKELMQQQNNYYLKQFSIMDESQEATRAVRHDMRNHLASIGSMIHSGDMEGALRYIERTSDFLKPGTAISSTGNRTVDSIVNYKLTDLPCKGIRISYHASLPNDLAVEPFDITVILGNLLDNAVEGASSSGSADPYIETTIEYTRGCLLICVRNTYDGRLNQSDGHLFSTKKDPSAHGIGIKNIKAMAAKYHGNLDINYDDSVFEASVLLFV